jgi:hypothetical protein
MAMANRDRPARNHADSPMVMIRRISSVLRPIAIGRRTRGSSGDVGAEVALGQPSRELTRRQQLELWRGDRWRLGHRPVASFMG